LDLQLDESGCLLLWCHFFIPFLVSLN